MIISRLSGWLLLLCLSACGAQNNISDGKTLDALRAQFQKGEAQLSCTLGCSGTYGSQSRAFKDLYTQQMWQPLADQILGIGFTNDQSWFYLPSAAEGLGYDDAAQRYYFMSLVAHPRCKELLNVCDGLDLPTLTQTRLAALNSKMAASPAFALPVPSKASIASGMEEIPLVNARGVREVPVLLDGQIPLHFVVDTGATLVNIPVGLAVAMIHQGLLQKGDIIGAASAFLGNGTQDRILIFHIKTLQVGNIVEHNVVGSIGSPSSDLLLGQSFLSQVKSWSIDNSRNMLLLQQ